MRFDNFWEFVKDHPWFLRLINLGDYYGPSVIDRRFGTEELAIYLTGMLPESVDWIAPRPWSREVLEMKTLRYEGGGVKFTKEVVRGKHTVETAIFFEIFWHFEGEKPFGRHEEIVEDESVGETVERIQHQHRHGRVIIDVVVRVHHKRTKQWRRCNSDHSMAFDLYFPWKKRKLGVPSRDSQISNLG